MGAVVFCNIAWMKNYRGITDEDQPYNGGSFVKENNDAMEQKKFSAHKRKVLRFRYAQRPASY